MQTNKCNYLGCNEMNTTLDDVEIAPGVIEKRYVCKEHLGQLTGNISMRSNFKVESNHEIV